MMDGDGDLMDTFFLIHHIKIKVSTLTKTYGKFSSFVLIIFL